MNIVSTIIAVAILAIILFLAVRSIIKTKKRGGCPGCSCGCSASQKNCCCGDEDGNMLH